MTKAAMLGELSAIKEFFDRSTRVLEEGDSQFTPAPGMFTAAQQVAHVAQTIEWFLDGAFAPGGFSFDFPTMDREVRAVTSLAAARAWLDNACEKAKGVVETRAEAEWLEPLPPGPVMGGMPRLAVLSAMNDHTAHHRGALTVYSRLLGKTPPMPYGDM